MPGDNGQRRDQEPLAHLKTLGPVKPWGYVVVMPLSYRTDSPWALFIGNKLSIMNNVSGNCNGMVGV